MNSSKTDPEKHMATVYATYELERKAGGMGEREREEKLIFHSKEGDR